MQESALLNGAPPVPVVPTKGQAWAATPALLFTPERLRELVAALEEPFDVAEIKWRVTNTSQIGSRNGPRFRGQMLAYADPRAYTDRLNDLFTPSGWTRDYSVQLVQNFERKERGSAARTITAKIVVTCKVTLYGFATHTGLGEEWADNDNAGTAAEAQAFKRACSCFGLGRYLYDLDGQWVDLDDKKRPLETPRLPDWARPKTQQPRKQGGSAEQQTSSPQHKQNGNGTPGKRPRWSVPRRIAWPGEGAVWDSRLQSRGNRTKNRSQRRRSREDPRHGKAHDDLRKVAGFGAWSGALAGCSGESRGAAVLDLVPGNESGKRVD